MKLLLALLVGVTTAYVLAHLVALMTFVLHATPGNLKNSSRPRRAGA